MLFEKIGIINENFEYEENMYVGVRDDRIVYIGKEKPVEDFGEKYDGNLKVLMPGFVNAHTHSTMTLLRGYAENLPLDRWLNEKVFPFEDKLTVERAYYGTALSIAEMLACGTTSCSDMYYFADGVIKAVRENKFKMNFSRSISSFTDKVDFEKDYRVNEGKDAFNKYHNTENGRIKVDFSLHSEYTNTYSMIEQFGEFSKTHGAINHIHLSETKAEHENCKKKYGKTPARLFYDAGVLDAPTIFAHCVYVEDSDIELFKEKGVTVAHCPVSNLKLGSGVCNTYKLLENGINVAIGTDSASSNNALDMTRDMFLASILPKGMSGRADIVSPSQVLKMATRNGALAQGREDCGLVKEGFKADLCVVDLDKANMYPTFDVLNNLVYSMNKSDIVLTMVDGDILYKNGEFKYIDVEKIGAECDKIVRDTVAEVNS